MIRVLIAEDEPPIQRRTKRMIERIDADFTVAATAGDGEEALEKLHAEHFDVLFTDIRMPVMNGMQLMEQARRLYPDCSIVVLSGYQDFEYVSTAVRAQAVDYLLKPVSEETLEKLLFKLKETFISHKQERMQQSVAARIRHMLPASPPDGLQAVRLGICLFCAGAMPQRIDVDLYDHVPDVWQKVSLTGMTKALCRGGVSFVQEFMGDTPSERILVYQPSDGAEPGWTERLYLEVLERSELPVSCVCLKDTAAVADIGRAHQKLRRLLSERIVIGKNLYEQVGSQALEAMQPEGGDFAEDSDAAAQFAAALAGRNPRKNAAFRRMLLERFQTENWTQRRVLLFFRRAVTLLDTMAQDSGAIVAHRDWFYAAVGMAASLSELDEIVKSLDGAEPAPGDGNETIQKVRDYLHASYAQHITGQTLARKFGYVPSYIAFLFRQVYGQSPAEYLTSLRLSRAKDLMLAQPAMLVREVAERVGFKNQYHFSRVFKKNEGLWPSEFRG